VGGKTIDGPYFGFYGDVFTKNTDCFRTIYYYAAGSAFRLIADKNNACARTPQIMLQVMLDLPALAIPLAEIIIAEPFISLICMDSAVVEEN